MEEETSRKTSKDYMAKCRLQKTDEEKEEERRKDQQRKSDRRSKMSEEERDLVREKDRMRKKKKREQVKAKLKADLKPRVKKGEFAHKGEYYNAMDKRYTKMGFHMANKDNKNYLAYYNKKAKGLSRNGQTEEERLFEAINRVIKMRKMRKNRNGRAHLLDNLWAKQDMRNMKENGRYKDYMKRKSQEKDEEILWRKFMNKGQTYKEVLEKKKPEVVELLEKKDKEKRRQMEENERIEKELDEKGRWNYNSCMEEYYWSIPDENGHHMSLATFNKEEEEVPLTLEEIRARRDPEEEERYQREIEDEEYKRVLREIYDYEGEMRRRKRKEKAERLREEMSKPIDMPIVGEKCEYEKLRDERVRERFNAMKESGMFNEKELDNILKSKMYD